MEYRTRQMKILILRDITSRLQQFSPCSRLCGSYSKETSMKRTSKVQYSRETETEGFRSKEKFRWKFMRINVGQDIHRGWLLIDQGHGRRLFKFFLFRPVN